MVDLHGHHPDDWINSTGMDSNVSEPISVDDMYLVLQTDMIDIKKQEKSLMCEIEELSTKFKNLLKTCGLEAEFPDTYNFPAPPPTPSFLQNNITINHLNNVSSSTSSDEDYLLQQLLQFPIGSLLDSDNDSPYLENSTNKPFMDSNCNYVDTELITELPIIPPPPSDNDLISENSSYSKNVKNVSESTSSDISNCRTSTSDGYPRSSGDSSVSNMEKEYLSRIRYYSDFTIDRQQKIKTMDNKLVGGSTSTPKLDKMDGETTELFCRHVEGAEDGISSIRVSGTASSSGSVSDCSSTGTSGSSSKKIRSSKSDNRISRNKTSSSHASRKSNSFPKASSTMIEDISPSSQGRHKSSSIPQASSTMIEEDFKFKRSSGCGSSNDRDSVYTWSINRSDDTTLEKSFFRNYKNQHKKMSSKVQSGYTKSDSSKSSSGKESDAKIARLHRNKKELNCQDYKLYKMIGERCSLKMLESMSAIEPTSGNRDAFILGRDSLCDDDFHGRSNTLPRSSTRLGLVEKSSGSSSMEARRASMPDILSVCTPYEDRYTHSIPSSTTSDSADSSPLRERLSTQGKSSTSAGTSGSQSYSGHNVTSPPEVSAFPGNVTVASTAEERETEGLIDSILTDSPNSVSSSGIYVPCNSPIMTDNSCAASRGSYATTSEKIGNSPHKFSVNGNSPCKPKVAQVQLFSTATSEHTCVVVKKSDPIFKVPKNTEPLRKLLRLKRKSKTPDSSKRNFLTKYFGPSSVQSDPLSKRRLFSSSRTNSETKLMDKKAVIKKFKRFSDSFYKRDKSGNISIETLAHF